MSANESAIESNFSLENAVIPLDSQVNLDTSHGTSWQAAWVGANTLTNLAPLAPTNLAGVLPRLRTLWASQEIIGINRTNLRQIQALDSPDLPPVIRNQVHQSALLAETYEATLRGDLDDAFGILNRMSSSHEVTHLRDILLRGQAQGRLSQVMNLLRAVVANEAQDLRSNDHSLRADLLEQSLFPAFQQIQHRVTEEGLSLSQAVQEARSSSTVLDELVFRFDLQPFFLLLETQPLLNERDLSGALLACAQRFVHDERFVAAAQLSGQLQENAYVRDGVRELLARIPERERESSIVSFLQNLGLITAADNLSVFRTAAHAMAFAGSGGLGEAVAERAGMWAASRGASSLTRGITEYFTQNSVMGGTLPLLTPRDAPLTLTRYLEEFGDMFSMGGVLGARGLLMSRIQSPALQYASIIGTLSAYDYVTDPVTRRLPLGINLLHSVGQDVLMRSGELLHRVPRNVLPTLGDFLPDRNLSSRAVDNFRELALLTGALCLSGCRIHQEGSSWEPILSMLGIGLPLLGMARGNRPKQDNLLRMIRSALQSGKGRLAREVTSDNFNHSSSTERQLVISNFLARIEDSNLFLRRSAQNSLEEILPQLDSRERSALIAGIEIKLANQEDVSINYLVHHLMPRLVELSDASERNALIERLELLLRDLPQDEARRVSVLYLLGHIITQLEPQDRLAHMLPLEGFLSDANPRMVRAALRTIGPIIGHLAPQDRLPWILRVEGMLDDSELQQNALEFISRAIPLLESHTRLARMLRIEDLLGSNLDDETRMSAFDTLVLGVPHLEPQDRLARARRIVSQFEGLNQEGLDAVLNILAEQFEDPQFQDPDFRESEMRLAYDGEIRDDLEIAGIPDSDHTLIIAAIDSIIEIYTHLEPHDQMILSHFVSGLSGPGLDN